MTGYRNRMKIIYFLLIFVILQTLPAQAQNYDKQTEKFLNWLMINRDKNTGLPHSHVGDERFENWAITYDSALVTLAYIATGKTGEAKQILDFYIDTPEAWRLGGIIEAINPTNPGLGEDWSVRTGANLWIGIAGFYLYQATHESKYLELARKLGEFSLSLQNNEENDLNFGAIRLGPQGGPNVASDQHLDYDENKPSFYDIYATEHNIDAYTLFTLLYDGTKDTRYRKAKSRVLNWLKKVAFNNQEHRLNRGARATGGVDTIVATDVQSWGISAIGVGQLDNFEPGLAEKMIAFAENNCLSEVTYNRSDGSVVRVTGVDFIDRKQIRQLGRKSLVSPEWTFQLINAYLVLEKHFSKNKDLNSAVKYKNKRQALIASMLMLADESDNTLSYPYATEPDALIGHEYRTPSAGNHSAAGVAYAIMALSEFDPLSSGK